MNPLADDETLMRRVAARDDTTAFDAVFERHHRAVWAFARGLTSGDEALAEDVTQECFVRLWRARHTYGARGPATLRTYLLTIVRRLIVDEWRRKQRCCLPPPEPLTGDPETVLVGNETARSLARAIGNLPPLLREVVLLKNDGLRYDEIAVVAGCAVGTVRSRLHAARQQLRAALEELED